MATHALVILTVLLMCISWIMETEGKRLHISRRRQSQDNCSTPSGAAGTCTPYQKCVMHPSSPISRTPSICRMDTYGPIICCPTADRKEKMQLACGLSPPSISSTRLKRQTGLNAIGKKISARGIVHPMVVGGKDAPLGQWPWMGLIYHEDDNQRNSPICGATLISNKALLTAAHCFLGRMKPTFVIRLGEHNLMSSQTRKRAVEIKIKKIVTHPGFQYPVLYDDIAVLHLESQVSLNRSINIVCLPKGFQNETFVGKNATVTGWGSLEAGGSKANILQELQLLIVPNKQCQEKYDKLPGSKTNLPNGITKKILCAGFEKAKDACQGDSGGPLVFQSETRNWFQIGIVSAGFECGVGIPGLYTRVTEYLDWITKNMA